MSDQDSCQQLITGLIELRKMVAELSEEDVIDQPSQEAPVKSSEGEAQASTASDDAIPAK